MRYAGTIGLAVAMVASMAACSRVETPAETASDVSAARQEAREDVNETVRDAQEDVIAGRETPGAAEYDVLMARLEGEHKVRIEACEGQPSDVQSDCKERADEAYEAAKASASAARQRM